MSHFAELDENNTVIRVLVGDDNMPNEGYDWFVENFGGTWVQTSYNGAIRKNFAGVGFTYNEELDAFIAPQPFPSWILNETACKWFTPVPYPLDGKTYKWDEDSTTWKEIVE